MASRWIFPEGYIAKVRTLLEVAPPIDDRYLRAFSISFKLWATEETMAKIAESAPIKTLYAYCQPKPVIHWYNKEERQEWRFSVEETSMKQFFAALPTFREHVTGAWHFVEMSGPGCK